MTGEDRATRDIPVRWRVLLRLIRRLPQGAISRATGRLARLPVPAAVRGAVLGAFARSAGIDTSELDRPLAGYESLDAFFVRRLRAGARSWPRDADVFASPVDGIVSESGSLQDGRVVQAKGISWAAADLLDDHELARTFDGGEFVTIYLSPRHYHRIHSPIHGRIVSARHVPGALMPVNAPAMASITDLLPRNERLICFMESEAGRIAVVAIGAFNVGRITADFDAGLVTNRRGALAARHDYAPPIEVERGEEIMAFHLGSTVVVFFERGACRLVGGRAAGDEIRLGEPMAEPLRD